MGITSLYVTHDQDEAMSLSDRIVVMNRGRVEQVGTPADIYLRPASVFVADFIGRAGFLPCRVGRVAPNGAMIRLMHRELVVPAHSKIREGDDAMLLVRPESVRLTPASEHADGTVISASYLGASAEYEVETLAGSLFVSVPSPDPASLLGEGCHVQVSIDERQAFLLPDAPHPAPQDVATNAAPAA
jgi:iron(III) transport system ATP-binding protein